ncbi:hypothetical protein IWW50_000419 [Coemansia erecta]|nr:hypothetical protein GGF43_000198 [Coemansia sp. RSA 2618]KAJ2830218.1 hypothetical protein IWW50_000419 [Coemansia erecta]
MEAGDKGRVDTIIEWTDGPADSVAIRGTFSDSSDRWWQETIALQPADNGHYSAVLRLRPGRYEFKFVINGSDWRISPSTYATADDGRGNVNNIVEVPGPDEASSDTVLLINDSGRGMRDASDITLGHGDTGLKADVDGVSERSRLLGTRSGGKSPGSATGNQLPHGACLPGAAPQAGDDDSASQSGSRLRRYLIGAAVVLLFVLLGVGSALMDSV